ncbi:MAG: hypothetical protein ACHQPH_23375 [Reyranellales bacterium]|jgi:hypothetical protein
MSQQLMQVELFEGTNALITAWMKRRQEAVETGLAALQKISASQDPALAARICADWMGGSLNRMLADFSDARDHSVRMVDFGQKTVQTVMHVQAETVADEVAKAAAATESTLREAA